jgi:hypothetical protein
MSTMMTALNTEELLKHGYNEGWNRYIVVHPLDDIPEDKIDTEGLGPMRMTSSVKWSLLSLRGYLILMFVLVLYHVLQLAGLFGGTR